MKPAPFAYVAPSSLAEALDVLAAHGETRRNSWPAGRV